MDVFRVRDRRVLTLALTVDPLYLQHHHSDKAIDFRVTSQPINLPTKCETVCIL